MQEKFSNEQVAKIYSSWIKKLQKSGKNHNEILLIAIRCANRYLNISEQWVDIPEYEGLYQVSNFGRVKGLDRKVNSIDIKRNRKPYIFTVNGKIRKQIINCGYPQTSLKCNNKEKSNRIHRLVCNSFHKNPENKPQVNHIDGIKINNFYLNLEWATQSENIKSGIAIGVCKKPPSQSLRCGKLHQRSKAIIQMTMDGEFVNKYDAMMDAQKLTGILHGGISAACKGKYSQCGGYKWKFAV